MGAKVIICGGRDFVVNTAKSRYVFYDKIDRVLSSLEVDCIICGGAKGADTFGKEYAEYKGIPVVMCLANWDLYGKKAGYLRNQEMGMIATHCIAFWDLQSKGTSHMIDIMKGYNKPVKIFPYVLGGKNVS